MSRVYTIAERLLQIKAARARVTDLKQKVRQLDAVETDLLNSGQPVLQISEDMNQGLDNLEAMSDEIAEDITEIDWRHSVTARPSDFGLYYQARITDSGRLSARDNTDVVLSDSSIFSSFAVGDKVVIETAKSALNNGVYTIAAVNPSSSGSSLSFTPLLPQKTIGDRTITVRLFDR